MVLWYGVDLYLTWCCYVFERNKHRRRVCQKFKQHAPKGQISIAQGNALGIWHSINNAPCKGNCLWLNRVALTGR